MGSKITYFLTDLPQSRPKKPFLQNLAGVQRRPENGYNAGAPGQQHNSLKPTEMNISARFHVIV
jgi:hypothetical protein